MELTERLKKVLIYLGAEKNAAELARRMSLKGSQNISNIITRGSIPRIDFIEKMRKAFPNEINYDWLISGEGEMTQKKIINNGNQAINVTSDNSTSTITNQVGNKIDNNDYSQILQLKEMELQALKQQLASQQREIEVLKNQLKDKDMIIDLLKKS